MKRKIYSELQDWKSTSNGSYAILIEGARRIGKSYIVEEFARNEYDSYLMINFRTASSDVKSWFDIYLDDIDKLLANIQLHYGKRLTPRRSIIVFDEIQACPQAITSLKYFNEEANEYHIVALGSLLGVSVNRGNFSFPVGKVQFLTMHPMDFEEYLLAKGEEYLVGQIKDCYATDTPLDALFHERALDYYKEYLFVGGMPEVVENYIKNKNTEMVRIAQQTIIESYQNDMGKYNKQSEIPKTKIVYKNISTQLAKENKKFQYKNIKSGGRASEFENAIEWLCLAGVASQLYRIEQIALPLNAYRSLSDFKFYMNDVGLCGASQDIHFDDIERDNPLLYNFKGGLTENYVFNQFTSNGFDLYYWTSGNQAEIDFIVRISENIIPVEVKSSDNTRSRSLSVYMNKYEPAYSIRLSTKNFGFENGIKSVPLYAIFCIR